MKNLNFWLRIVFLLFGLHFGSEGLLAQSRDQINAQKREIERLEEQIAREEREISSLKKGRSSAEERLRKLARQIDNRNSLLEHSEAEQRVVKREVHEADSTCRSLSRELETMRERYAVMVREAYRNYKLNNYLTYIFSANSFSDVVRRIANIREVAALRSRQMARIEQLREEALHQQELLARRQQSLDSVQRSLERQRSRLKQDQDEAKRNVSSLSKREKQALQRKVARQKELDAAIAELRKLTKGNKEGASFSAKTSNLRLPVEGGSVKKYHGNMAEIKGRKGAAILSIYEGKVVDVKQNRMTGKYDVYIAHGEYITSYANLASVEVQKGSSVKRNQRLGTIGSSVDVLTMQSEYLLIFGIYPPNPSQKMLASECFKK